MRASTTLWWSWRGIFVVTWTRREGRKGSWWRCTHTLWVAIEKGRGEKNERGKAVGWTGLRRRKGRKMERVVVALGDRKCVKLQRSVILMTPNDTAPSVHGSFPPPGPEEAGSPPRPRLISFLPVPSLPLAKVFKWPLLLPSKPRFTESALRVQLLIDGG